MKYKEDVEESISERFDIIEKVGRGRSTTVLKARDYNTHNLVAIKKIYDVFSSKAESERIYKEIIILENLNEHENIIKLKNVILSENKKDIYFVLDYMEANLFNVIRANILTEKHITYITYQILKAIKYMHSVDLVNRNLKPTQILINSDCKIKIDDFSLARIIGSDFDDDELTDYISTRWYRAPEIILGARIYRKASDMWSLGCIIGEMINSNTLFPGTCTMNQLELILQLTDIPSQKDQDDIQGSLIGLLKNVNIKHKHISTFKETFVTASEDLLDLLEKLLVFNPNKRLTVEEALNHKYFKEVRNADEEVIIENKTKLSSSLNIKEKICEYIKEKEYSID